jgi:uncharacterized membrane protein HdeD (DUF308 family)
MNSPGPRQVHEPVWALWVAVVLVVLGLGTLVFSLVAGLLTPVYGGAALTAAGACFLSVGLPAWRRVRAHDAGHPR